MSRLYMVGATLLLLSVLESSIVGQVAKETKRSAGDEKTTSAASQPADSTLRVRARELIRSAADDASKWDDTQAAVRVLSKAADLLWDEDPERARAWLTRAWEVGGQAKDKNSEQPAVHMRGSARSRARSEVLSVAQQHDAKFAKKLIGTLDNENEEADYKAQRGLFDDRTARSEQLLNLALANVESNPPLAESLAERSLADGISYQLQEVLLKLRERDPNLANRLFDIALTSLAAAFSQPSEGQILASYLFTPGRTLGVDAHSKVKVSVNPLVAASPTTPAQADPARARRFLTIMQQRLLAMPVPSLTPNPQVYAQEFITLVRSLSFAYSSYASDLWPLLEQRVVQFAPDALKAAMTSPGPASQSAHTSGTNPGEEGGEAHLRYMDDLENAADSESDPVARKLAYVKAALSTNITELERGRNIAFKIEEKELREQVISFLVYRAALDALEKKHVEEALSLASNIKQIQKAIILITAAQAIASERPKGEAEWQAGNRKLRVLEILSEAEKVLKREDNTTDALRLRLGLVVALAQADSLRAFSAMGEIVSLINGMQAFDFMDVSAPRVNGLSEPTAQLLLPHIANGYGISDVFIALARADFDSSIQTANHLTSPVGRGLALFEIGRSVLEARAKKTVAEKAPAPAALH